MGKEVNSNAVNLLCEGTMIVGDVKTKNDIRIDGMIKGKILTSFGGGEYCKNRGGCGVWKY